MRYATRINDVPVRRLEPRVDGLLGLSLAWTLAMLVFPPVTRRLAPHAYDRRRTVEG